jgi:hypothetical protein
MKVRTQIAGEEDNEGTVVEGSLSSERVVIKFDGDDDPDGYEFEWRRGWWFEVNNMTRPVLISVVEV